MAHWSLDAVVVGQGYVEGIRLAGGRPIVLPADPHWAEDPDDVLDLLDGLMMVGGDDVAPETYGAARHPATGLRNERRDATELGLARGAIDRDLPMLAICRGFQVVNVATGGTLEQHLPDRLDVTPHRLSDSEYGLHEVATEPETRLREIVGERLRVHSHHHQAVDRVGDGLIVSARADDGVIEGLEHPGRRFCVAVLWHPDAEPEGHGAPLFKALVSSAA